MRGRAAASKGTKSCRTPQTLSGLKSVLSDLNSALSGLKSALSALESALSGLKSALSCLKFTLLGLKSALSDLESALSGLKSGWTDGRTDGMTNESPPVFYRTSSPLGPLPCFPSLHITIMQSRATGIADHILPLGDLLILMLVKTKIHL